VLYKIAATISMIGKVLDFSAGKIGVQSAVLLRLKALAFIK
jgi:hypothetical protein